jgi:3-isopropylmalate dehydratase small subunit
MSGDLTALFEPNLFAELRYRDDGAEDPDFVLNRPAYPKAVILVAGDVLGRGRPISFGE